MRLPTLPFQVYEEQVKQMFFNQIMRYALFDILDGRMSGAMTEQYVPFLEQPTNAVELSLNYMRTKLIGGVRGTF
ncbi:MAG: hypothetical protein F4X44_05920 [Gammaproteobacteria bacterium]|nr:hypothetical protein [Gammaproteobacteria bacterium]